MVKTVNAADLMTATEAANMLGRRPATVYSYFRRRQLNGYRVRGGSHQLVFVRADVAALKTKLNPTGQVTVEEASVG